MNKELKVGDKVIVVRKIGKHGEPHDAAGTIERFSNGVTIGGERTAYIKYDDGESVDGYWHPLSKIRHQNEVN